MVNSKRTLKFSESDLSKIREILTELSQKVKYQQSLNQLFSRWRRFCVEIQRGFSGTVYDYENELSVRDILEEIARSLSEDGRQKIQEHIKHDDNIFILATQKSVVPEHKKDIELEWWHKRIPIRFTEDLQQEFSDAGYKTNS